MVDEPIFDFDAWISNGIDPDTGSYLTPPIKTAALAKFALKKRLDKQDIAGHRNRRRLKEQGVLGLQDDIVAGDLSQTGWGVIFAETDAQRGAAQDALGELLTLRREQAGLRYRGDLIYKAGQSRSAFLKSYGANIFGLPDPAKLPYYLLIVGSPELIPFEFQYMLDVQYAVGRIFFDSLDEYRSYAATIVATEKKQILRSRRVSFFAAQTDGLTVRSALKLVEPLAAYTAAKYGSWQVDIFSGAGAARAAQSATKTNLRNLLCGADKPAFVFTATHGIGFYPNDPRQLSEQGALVCQEWPGYLKPAPPSTYFAAADVEDATTPEGLIAFNFACFGAGTPINNDFYAFDALKAASKNVPAALKLQATKPFVAALPRRLLGHPNGGALAIIGHIERTFPDAFANLNDYKNLLSRLLNGYPVGYAMDTFGNSFGDASTMLQERQNEDNDHKPQDPAELAKLWLNINDLRNIVVAGDPAVRLCPADSPLADPVNSTTLKQNSAN